jgi:hypothetical protein
MKNLFYCSIILLALSSCQGMGAKPAADSAAYTVPDETAIDKAVLDAYGAIALKKASNRAMMR